MPTTLKAVVIPGNRKADGTYNVKLRITHNRKVKYLPTTWFVRQEDITPKGAIKRGRNALMIGDFVNKMRMRLGEYGYTVSRLSMDEVVDIITRSDRPDEFKLDFVSYFKTHVDSLVKAGRDGTAKSYAYTLRALMSYIEKDEMDISELTPSFLKAWLKKAGEKSVKKQSVVIHYGNVRAVFNKAVEEFNDEYAGEINIKRDPFKKVEAPKISRKPAKRAVDVEVIREIARISDSECSKLAAFTRDLFLLSFMFAGMNMADMWECPPIKNGRLTYCRKKTRDRREDNAEISIKVEPEAQAIMDRWADESGKRAFRFYKKYSRYECMMTSAHMGMKALREILAKRGIDIHLVFYAARHSWATIAVNDVGVDKYTVHTALNHVDRSMAITDVYILKSWKQIDKANRAVIDYVFGGTLSE